MEIKLGTKILKPVITQAECDAYSAVVDAITAHNAAAAVGEALWSMDDQPEFYVVVEAGTKPDPADAPKPTPYTGGAACSDRERPNRHRQPGGGSGVPVDHAGAGGYAGGIRVRSAHLYRFAYWHTEKEC